MLTEYPTIRPEQLRDNMHGNRDLALLDVRSGMEYRSGHIPGAKSLPVQELDTDALHRVFKRSSPGRDETLYLTCHSGIRARQAAEKLRHAGFHQVVLVEGGTQGWQQTGLPLRRCGQAMSLQRQAQIAIGTLVILKVFLGFSVHELFYALAAMIGIGLIVAGATRWCGMEKLMAYMPWNQAEDCPQQANA
jgi:rhodanese-related sulfurtransferase